MSGPEPRAGELRPVVLYVDDESLNLRVFEANFRDRYQLVCVSSGARALEVMATRPTEIGVILSDQRMPQMTGVELLERARELVPEAQRMLLTAYSDMQAVMDAVNRGQVSRYFVKPWVKDELVAAVDDALRIFTLQVKLRLVEHRMLQSERLAAVGQVSAGVAHELMNPVAYMSQNVSALRGELELLTRYLSPRLAEHPDEEVSRTLADLPGLLSDVELGAKHIRQVALAVRSQVRGEDFESECELSEVATFASKLARGELHNRVRLTVNGPELRVRGGPVRLTQVLLNLVVNAAHAMEGLDRPGLIELRWDQVDTRARIRVTDNGAGIPPAVMPRIWEPLFTTKAAGKGTGLGLPLCREIITGLGGEITLDSTVGAGTEATILLPLA